MHHFPLYFKRVFCGLKDIFTNLFQKVTLDDASNEKEVDLDRIMEKAKQKINRGLLNEDPLMIVAPFTPLFDNTAVKQWPKGSMDPTFEYKRKKFDRYFEINIDNIRKDDFRGSFMVHVAVKGKNGKWKSVGQRSVLSR